MIRIIKRLRQEERGNVLYMTVVMLMLLVVFSFVLVNVIYVGVTKIKAQNAADNIALSAATLKARVLNKTVNYNGILYGVIRLFDSFPVYPSVVEALVFGTVPSVAIQGLFIKDVIQFNNEIYNDGLIDRIAQGNGIDGATGRYAIHPVNILHLTLGMKYDWRMKGFTLPFPGVVPILYELEPNHAWYVQSRVEWQTKKSIIGGERLGIELPDIVARARAEVFDSAMIKTPYLHNWRVRLVHPDEGVDQYIRDQINSTNTGGNTDSGTYGSVARPDDPDYGDLPPELNPALNPNLSQEDATFNFISTMSDDQQYHYYQQKKDNGEHLNNREVCQYYQSKDKTWGLTIPERFHYIRAKAKKNQDEVAEKK
jgi:Putative Flp pilus-assembly TadE/G-like